MLYLIGLGLELEGISKKGLEIVKRCKRIYLEKYTVDFPYSLKDIEEIIGKKIIPAERIFVESMEIIDEAKKMDIALLVYGSPLTATTHISLLQEAKRCRVKVEVIYNASILDAVAQTGLQLYKFGKITSMPKWDIGKNFVPDSFIQIIKENLSINAHTLLLIDIGMNFDEVLRQLKVSAKNNNLELNKLIVCQSLGTKKKKIDYKNVEEFENENIRRPYCIIIPSKLHFMEKEILEELYTYEE
ncbi:MAG: diphthine synthase [archaeon]